MILIFAAAQNPRSALVLFDRLGLYSTIFTDPTTKGIPQPRTDEWHSAYDCFEVMRATKSPGSIYDTLVPSDESVEIAWTLVALTPWATIPTPSPRTPGGKPILPFATLVARQGLKANNHVCDVITGAFRHLDEVMKLKEAVVSDEPWVKQRDVLGMTIRRWDAQGGHWKLHVLLAIFVEAMRSDMSNGN